MALTKKDLVAIRDEIDEALEDKLSDALSDLPDLAFQVEWMRRDLEPHIKNLKGYTKLMRSLVEKFAELRAAVKKQASK